MGGSIGHSATSRQIRGHTRKRDALIEAARRGEELGQDQARYAWVIEYDVPVAIHEYARVFRIVFSPPSQQYDNVKVTLMAGELNRLVQRSSRTSYGCLCTCMQTKSGWPDLNRRPLRPERSALPSCATPRRITTIDLV
jgi:hypothetical protein